MEKFKWIKMKKPTVTKCCRSFNHTQVQANDLAGTGGDMCGVCKKIDPDGIRLATAEDMRFNGLNITDTEFDAMYE